MGQLRILIDDVGQTFHRQLNLLIALIKRGKLQQRPGDIATDDPEGNQHAQGEIALQHQPHANPEHQQPTELVEKFADLTGRCTERHALEAFSHKVAIAVLPFPTGCELKVLRLHRLNATQHLNQVALGARLGHRAFANQVAIQRRHTKHQQQIQRQGAQGHHREQR